MNCCLICSFTLPPPPLNLLFAAGSRCWERCPGFPRTCSQPARGVLFPNCIFGKLQTFMSYMAAVLGLFLLSEMHRDYFDYEKKRSLDSFP